MVKIVTLNTERLILLQWQPNDYAPFFELNNDPAVMQYYPNILTKLESDTLATKFRDLIEKQGWGFWSVKLKEDNQFIGFVGLNKPDTVLLFSPCVEIGWRLAKNYWGKGYATEAANAALKYAFETLQLDEVVSFTSVHNIRSKSVMEKLHMVNTMQNFDHPNIPAEHKLREHALYKITKAQWVDINL